MIIKEYVGSLDEQTPKKKPNIKKSKKANKDAQKTRTEKAGEK